MSGKSTLIKSILGETLLIDNDTLDNIEVFDKVKITTQTITDIHNYMRNFRELIHLNPPVKIYGSVGLIQADIWIRECCIRDNIILEQDFIKEKYDKISKILNLESIFMKFPEMDSSKALGELNFSEKFMLNLARVLYRNTSIIIVEDCIWRLDEYWKKIVIKSVILDEYSSKTWIIVTHNHELIKRASKIIYMEKGKINTIGRYEQIRIKPVYSELKELIELEDKQISISMVSESETSLSKTSNVTRKIDEDLKESNPLDTNEAILSTSSWRYFFLSRKLSAFFIGFFVFIVNKILE